VSYPVAKADSSYTAPNGTMSIGDGAFYSCEDLETIILPEGLTSIGEKVFYKCNSLASVTLPASLTSIHERAFSDHIDCTAIVVRGSYAEEYCKEKDNITCKYSN